VELSFIGRESQSRVLLVTDPILFQLKTWPYVFSSRWPGKQVTNMSDSQALGTLEVYLCGTLGVISDETMSSQAARGVLLIGKSSRKYAIILPQCFTLINRCSMVSAMLRPISRVNVDPKWTIT
jgi:hypothetical protein